METCAVPVARGFGQYNTLQAVCVCASILCALHTRITIRGTAGSRNVLLTSVMTRLHEFIALCIVMYLLNCFIHCYVLYM